MFVKNNFCVNLLCCYNFFDYFTYEITYGLLFADDALGNVGLMFGSFISWEFIFICKWSTLTTWECSLSNSLESLRSMDIKNSMLQVYMEFLIWDFIIVGEFSLSYRVPSFSLSWEPSLNIYIPSLTICMPFPRPYTPPRPNFHQLVISPFD